MPLVFSQQTNKKGHESPSGDTLVVKSQCGQPKMDQRQFLILALCVVPALACMRRCYNESDLSDAAMRLSKRFPPPPELSPAADGDAPARCPVELYKTLLPSDTRVERRSVSPWRYVKVTNENYFPSTYMAAECLCYGCILIQKNSSGFSVEQSHDYNSRTILQSRMFLERELCKDKTTYRLRPVSVQVPVGCTCVRYEM